MMVKVLAKTRWPLTWYCLYNQFVCFTFRAATITNNLLKLCNVLHFYDKMQKPTCIDQETAKV